MKFIGWFIPRTCEIYEDKINRKWIKFNVGKHGSPPLFIEAKTEKQILEDIANQQFVDNLREQDFL